MLQLTDWHCREVTEISVNFCTRVNELIGFAACFFARGATRSWLVDAGGNSDSSLTTVSNNTRRWEYLLQSDVGMKKVHVTV